MDLFGIGPLELILILVVAIIVLGPAKTMNMAKGAGKMMGEVRRAFGDLSKAMEEEERDLNRTLRSVDEANIDRGNPTEDGR